MAEPFTYEVLHQLPTEAYMQEWDRYQDQDGEPRPLLSWVVDQAVDAITDFEEFWTLPKRNRELIIDMAAYMLASANHIKGTYENTWSTNYWGLYIVGSRARGEARPDSDLDLLSAGTFYRNQGFRGGYLGVRELVSGRKNIFDGFEIEAPDELPDEYNVGAVDRKYLLRARVPEDPSGIKMRYPKPEPVLPVDLSVVDLTFTNSSFDDFKLRLDVDCNGEELPRIPLVEVSTSLSR